MTDWGRAMFVTPGIVVDGKLDHHRPRRHQPRHPHPARQLVLRGLGQDERDRSSPKDPLGNPVDQRHPWNQTTIPKPQKRDLEDGNYSWVMSPRWFDKRTDDHLALDTGGGPLARLWATALANLVEDAVRAGRPATSVQIHLPKTASFGEMELRVEDPAAGRTRSSATARARTSSRTRRRWRCYFVDKALERVHAGDVKVFQEFKVPDEAHRLRLPRGGARRALAPPRDPRRQDRQLPPVPADAVEREPARQLRHARARTRTRCRACRSSRRTARTTSRASTSCARCAASIRACRAACTCTSATAGHRAAPRADVRRRRSR